MTITERIREELFQMQDTAYADFQAKLIPSADRQSVIGVRTPLLRKYAKKLAKDSLIEEFLAELPHDYFDENQLHAFVIAEEKDFLACVEQVQRFLPYVDNWATCDQLSPGVFRKNKQELLPYIRQWLRSDHTYTVRFAIGMLMQHFLDDDFLPEYPALVAGVHSGEYYINMEIAWYFATALAKQYDETISYLTENKLEKWTHNKTIQKAVESNRITAEKKAYLRTLRKK